MQDSLASDLKAIFIFIYLCVSFGDLFEMKYNLVVKYKTAVYY